MVDIADNIPSTIEEVTSSLEEETREEPNWNLNLEPGSPLDENQQGELFHEKSGRETRVEDVDDSYEKLLQDFKYLEYRLIRSEDQREKAEDRLWKLNLKFLDYIESVRKERLRERAQRALVEFALETELNLKEKYVDKKANKRFTVKKVEEEQFQVPPTKKTGLSKLTHKLGKMARYFTIN